MEGDSVQHNQHPAWLVTKTRTCDLPRNYSPSSWICLPKCSVVVRFPILRIIGHVCSHCRRRHCWRRRCHATVEAIELRPEYMATTFTTRSKRENLLVISGDRSNGHQYFHHWCCWPITTRSRNQRWTCINDKGRCCRFMCKSGSFRSRQGKR